jgi:tRNA dimethylallyltransferase
MKKIIVICGPTGIGKTSLSIALARRFNGEIIGADSMQIYQYMNIGTAKPSPAELKQARHHMIDFLGPEEEFDAGLYVKTADRVISDITDRGKLPILAGGTGLYIRALLHGLFRSRPICEKTLAGLNKELEEKGESALFQKLILCDPKAAEKIHPHDSFRVIRALEVYQTTGQKISDRQKKHNFNDLKYESLKFGLVMDRERLYKRINERVDLMLSDGLLNEVKTLIKKGYPLTLKSMQSIGYKHMGLFINKEVTWDEAVRLLKRDTRRYAKRQLTWFRKDKEIIWITPFDIDTAEKRIKDFLT